MSSNGILELYLPFLRVFRLFSPIKSVAQPKAHCTMSFWSFSIALWFYGFNGFSERAKTLTTLLYFIFVA